MTEILNNEVTLGQLKTRYECLRPNDYRLTKKLSGELILQGAYSWWTVDNNESGVEWRDMPTVVETDVNS